jgi:5-deoxy-glucuronate isomerase
MTLMLQHESADPVPGRLLTTGQSLEHCAMEVFQLAPGAVLTRNELSRELCLVLLFGFGRVSIAGLMAARIGGRLSPFAGPGYAVYVPAGRQITFQAEGLCEVALCYAADLLRLHEPRIITPAMVTISTRGSGVTERMIRDVLPETEHASNLLVVEVITPGGHWSSFPPHKHDTDDPPHETALEEVYYHRFYRTGGFGIQRVYTDDRTLDEVITLRDGCAVLVPRGYHPVCAAPGCDLYYLNVMAGHRRSWRVRIDPDHVPFA